MFVVAILGALVLVAIEFPLRQLMSQRSQISRAAVELQAVERHNAILKQDISALSKTSTIAAIAHQEYGLVHPGQRSYVILPSANAKQNMDPLTALSIPAEDLGSTPATTTPPHGSAAASQQRGSLWSRVLHHLEFWH